MDDRGKQAVCDACGTHFRVRFRYQVREEAGEFVHVCSIACQRKSLLKSQRCDVCDTSFQVEMAYQVVSHDGGRAYLCSMACREKWKPVRATGPRRIAVFNHKGGTGKTTTSINLAAGLAETGRRVLLIDADGQGNVGASLGIRGERTLYHALIQGTPVEECVVQVRSNLDILTSNETLAAAELHLAQLPQRDRVLRDRLASSVRGYDVVVLDCAPALSLMNQNALVYADSVLVPVACDYLSLVGVKQVLGTIKNVRRLLRHNVELLGVVPTFFDVRNRISRDALAALQKNFGDKCFSPVRVNTKLREAPRAKQTIFELAPGSHGAEDYLKLVERVFGESQAQAVQKTFPRPVAVPVVKGA
ncbi:MAG: ParA family protein [Myxococcota bacterium]